MTPRPERAEPAADGIGGAFSGNEWQLNPQRTWENGVALLEHELPMVRRHGVRGIERAVRFEPERKGAATQVLTAFVAANRRQWRLDDEAVRAARRVLRGGSADKPWWTPNLRDLTLQEKAMAAAVVLVTLLGFAAGIAALFQ